MIGHQFRRWRGVLFRFTYLVVGGRALGGWVPPNLEGPGHRAQTLALTPEEELSLGQQAYQEILSKSEIVRSGPEVERVRQVGDRIVRATEIEPLLREINL